MKIRKYLLKPLKNAKNSKNYIEIHSNLFNIHREKRSVGLAN